MPEFTEKGMPFPEDISQVPDIFLDFYSGDERFAYLRLKTIDCLKMKPKASWMRLSSPYNDVGDKPVGLVMCNVRFIRFDPSG